MFSWDGRSPPTSAGVWLVKGWLGVEKSLAILALPFVRTVAELVATAAEAGAATS